MQTHEPTLAPPERRRQTIALLAMAAGIAYLAWRWGFTLEPSLLWHGYYGGSTGLDGNNSQSLTRSPDITGSFVLHTTANPARRFSPGLKVDGSPFSSCAGHPASGEDWGVEAEKDWGTLTLWNGGAVTQQKVPTLRGDYRDFYAQVRDATLENAKPPVTLEDALRLMYALELCIESSLKRAPIPWDFKMREL